MIAYENYMNYVTFSFNELAMYTLCNSIPTSIHNHILTFFLYLFFKHCFTFLQNMKTQIVFLLFALLVIVNGAAVQNVKAADEMADPHHHHHHGR